MDLFRLATWSSGPCWGHRIVQFFYGLCKNSYLFTNSIGGPYDRSQYSGYSVRMLERLFGKPVTLTTLRHSYTSSLDYNRPIRELNEIAHSMGHSVGVQHMYRWDGLVGDAPETGEPL